MKTLVFVWMAVAGLVWGQQSEAEAKFYAAYAKSEQQAVARYPDAAVVGSAMHTRLLKIEKAWKDSGDSRYHAANKPMLLCEAAAAELAAEAAQRRQMANQQANNAASDGFQRHAEARRKRLEAGSSTSNLDDIESALQRAEAERNIRQRQQDIENLQRWSDDRR